MSNTENTNSKLGQLLDEGDFLIVPQLGDLIETTVINTEGREVKLDVNGLTTGVVRGRELYQESDVYSNLKKGDKIEATVVGLENENGEMELSFRFAGNKKSWEELQKAFEEGTAIKVKVLDANKGGLVVKAAHISGFLPVSQLSPDNYPRVTGGDKSKILDKLQSFVGKSMQVKILDLNEIDEKLILSEKELWEKEQKDVISQISVGNKVTGHVTALADFGAFVKFSPLSNGSSYLEGLVHISEIAWQRIDHPKDLLTVGAEVEAEIIGIEGSKVFLSMKKLIEDPWTDVDKKYKIGEMVEGTILKINPFGFFVELDKDIHGLAHVSELSNKPVSDPQKLGKIGEKRSFKIVSIEPSEHRLGLSLKTDKKKKTDAKVEEKKEVTEKAESTEKTAEKVEEKTTV